MGSSITEFYFAHILIAIIGATIASVTATTIVAFHWKSTQCQAIHCTKYFYYFI